MHIYIYMYIICILYILTYINCIYIYTYIYYIYTYILRTSINFKTFLKENHANFFGQLLIYLKIELGTGIEHNVLIGLM